MTRKRNKESESISQNKTYGSMRKAYIKLTEITEPDEPKDVYISTERIDTMEQHEGMTRIFMAGQTVAEVQESVEDVLYLLESPVRYYDRDMSIHHRSYAPKLPI
jgi:hypothetical protein